MRAWAAVLLLAACSSANASDPALVAARERWAERGSEDYTIDLVMGGAAGTYRVVVRDGEVTSVVPQADVESQAFDEPDLTVEDLFSLAAGGYDRVTAEYDVEHGYPRSLDLDPDDDVDDDETGWRITRHVPDAPR